MKRLSRLFILFVCVLGLVRAQSSSPEKKGDPIEITADGENHFAAGVATASGNVIVRYKGDVIYADRIIYDSKIKEMSAEGGVRIYSGKKVYRGEKVRYNFETQAVMSTDFRLMDYPLMAGGGQVSTPQTRTYLMKDGMFTTDNRQHPSYQFKAKTVVIYPDDEVVLKNVTVWAGNLPVAWIPIFAQAMNDDRSSYVFQVGQNSKQGYYMLNEFNWWASPSLRGTVDLDLRSKRGLAGGLGLDFNWIPGSTNYLQTYFADDDRPDYNDSSIPRGSTTSGRYLLGFKDNVPLGEGLTLQSDFSKLSDQHVTEDFFENEFRKNRQPDQMIALTQSAPNYSLTLLARKQINSFFETEERLPEVRFESKRAKLFGSAVAYEGETSLTVFRRRYAPENPYNTYFAQPLSATNPGDYSAYRYDTFHQFLYPQQYFNWLSITPRVGLRATYYDYNDSSLNQSNFIGLKSPGTTLSDTGRIALTGGLEASFKVSRVWSDVQSKSWGIDGLRHVMEPFANLQLTTLNDAKPQSFAGFDRRVASTRLAPINYTAYNSVDSIDNQSVVRVGVRNKVQTKRDGLNYDLLDWAVYTDYDGEGKFNTANGNNLSNIYSDFELKPLPWLSFNSYSGVDITGNGFDVSDNSIEWQATRALDVGLGNRYLNKFSAYPDSDLLYWKLFYRLNEHWQFETRQSFESNDSTLEEHEYTVYRDLSAWQMALSYRDRDNRQSKSEQQVYFSLTLKAFPNQKIGF